MKRRIGLEPRHPRLTGGGNRRRAGERPEEGGPHLQVQAPPRQRPRPEPRREDDPARQLPRRRRAHDERPLPLDAVGRPREERHPDRPGRDEKALSEGRARQAMPAPKGKRRSAASCRRSRCRASTAASRWRPTAAPPTCRARRNRPRTTTSPPAGTPGQEGDVIHVFRYDAKNGKGDARRRDRGPRPGRTRRRPRTSRPPHRPGARGRATSRSARTARRSSPRSTSPTAPRSSTRESKEVALREDGPLPVRRGDHARRQDAGSSPTRPTARSR